MDFFVTQRVTHRDQLFMDELLAVLQKNPFGIHKIFFCRPVTEQRYDVFFQTCLKVMTTLFGGSANFFEGFIDVVLTKADERHKLYWGMQMNGKKMDELKVKIQKDFGISCNVYTFGNDNHENLEGSVSKIQDRPVFQTTFMQKVVTLSTELQQNKDKAELLAKKVETANNKVEKINSEQELLRTELQQKEMNISDLKAAMEKLCSANDQLQAMMKQNNEMF